MKPHIISPLAQGKLAAVTPTVIPTFTPSPTPIPTATPTPSPTPIPEPITAPFGLEPFFIKYSNEYSIDNQLLKRIAKCESGFGSGASSNGYGGMFQFSEVLWIQTRTLMGLNADINLRFDREESIRTAAFMVSQGHLGIWPNCNR